ncbi:MAG: hypothetical protein RIT25_1820 [Planctomycetota bacterium]
MNASRRTHGIAESAGVKGLEKLTSVRLAEVLSQKGAIPAEAITDALYAQEQTGEPFTHAILDGGHITEWDLAKIVTEVFQLPFLMAGNHSLDEETKNLLPKEVLFENLIVPLEVFDGVLTLVMPILTPFDVLNRIQRESNLEIFPYVGLLSENKKVLNENFREFAKFHEDLKKKREDAAMGKGGKAAGDWMSIFDAGEEAIQSHLKKK